MTITLDTATQLETLALTIFNPGITPAATPGSGDKWGAGSGLTSQDDATDAQLYALLPEVIKTIDGRDVVAGLKYTLNYTNATQMRPKHWYLQTMEYDGSGYGWPASATYEFHPAQSFAGTATANSFGGSVGLAVCAASCNAWAAIIRLWLVGSYSLAVSQPA